MRILDVCLENTLIGIITENRKGGRFSYDPEIVKQYAGAPVLSLSLPAKERPFGEAKTDHWFNGLLPEGPRREAICRNLGINPYDWIGLLSEIGWECAGAVRVFSHGDAQNHPARYREIPKSILGEMLSSTQTYLPGNENYPFRMSLGGFQGKICICLPRLSAGEAYVDADNALLPDGEAASTHILKPENTAVYPGLAESEAWAMAAASHAARCSRVALLSLPNAPATLVVERYDRTGEDWPQGARRMHQEDACQALGFDPSKKYANPHEAKGSDPTYKSIANLLIKYAENPEEELTELLRQMAINLALGNWDAHAKNISFLYRKLGIPTVAPLYDVVPIAEIEPRTRYLSLRINGHIAPNDLEGKDIVAEAASWGMMYEKASTILNECFDQLTVGIRAARVIYPEAAKRHEANALARVARLLRSL